MQQLTFDFALPPESVSTLAIPFTADLKRALITHMVTAIIAVYQQHLQSLRQNTLPVELINRSLLMGHEYLPCSLV